jgi:c-di-GMP-binding flagellar brake protein YcgR
MTREKRAHTRVARAVPVKVTIPVNDSDLVIQTKNISCSGALCVADRKVDPMTKVVITMLLPQHNDLPSTKIVCNGVIVRVEEDKTTGLFDLGIFFNDIREKERAKLEHYIEHYA